MTDTEFYSNWFFWLSIAAIIIVAAAILLILVWLAARRILNLAVAALGLVQQIKANTEIIWALEETNQTAVNILEDAQQIRNHGGAVAQALHET